MDTTLKPIDELLRIPSPAPAPNGLAVDGDTLWMGSVETDRIYGIDRRQGTVFEEFPAPGTPVGICVLGDELRVVCDEEDGEDTHRFIRRYIPGKGFKDREKVACPDDTGSFLAWDGDTLFLSQRFNQKILAIEEDGRVLREISAPRQITGIVVVLGVFYLATTAGRDSGDFRITKLDARNAIPKSEDLASLPFEPRSLAFDGTRFWTNQRWENAIVAFKLP
jgi:hypothetical protein